MPEKIFGLTLFLDFFDRCHSLSSLFPPPAAVASLPLRYRGYVYDQETGLYYLQSRYYNPKIGRFINADAYVATGQGLLGNNMFTYCGNNPVNRADYTGKCWSFLEEIVCSIVTKMVNAIINNYYLLTNQATSPVQKSEYQNTAPWGKYGASRDGGTRTHKGIDFYPADGSNHLYGSDGTARDVYAMKDGEVVDYIYYFFAGTSAIVINHGDFYALYGEISTELTIGSIVSQGQKIGTMKKSTKSTLMLHLEIFVGGYDYYWRDNPYRIDPTFAYALPDWRR